MSTTGKHHKLRPRGRRPFGSRAPYVLAVVVFVLLPALFMPGAAPAVEVMDQPAAVYSLPSTGGEQLDRAELRASRAAERRLAIAVAEQRAAELAAKRAAEAKRRAEAARLAQRSTTRQQPALPPVSIPSSCKAYSGHKATACAMLPRYGFGLGQMPCLVNLWNRESGWNPRAHNPSSGAHGIPQALPGWKMGPGWQSDPVVQIRWGLGYIKGRYGTPCGAWQFFLGHNWY